MSVKFLTPHTRCWFKTQTEKFPSQNLLFKATTFKIRKSINLSDASHGCKMWCLILQTQHAIHPSGNKVLRNTDTRVGTLILATPR